MKKVKTIVICAILTILALACNEKNREGKVAVVDLKLLYSSFSYQKELDLDFQKLTDDVSREKDSLDKEIRFVESELKKSTELSGADKNVLYERAYNEYVQRQEYLQYEQDSVAQMYTSKVWKHLNSYLEKYGDEKDYDVIIGTQGDGTVMYVKDQVDITDDVIAYANQKYEGE